MAMTVGTAGPDVKSDVKIEATPSENFSFEFTSSASTLYDEAIESQIEAAAARFGRPPLHLRCEDSGALPYTWEGRLNAIFSVALGVPISASEARKTPAAPGLRRSRLYVPGSSPKLFHNAPLFGADAIILDLEESVHSSRKEEAIALIASALAHLDWGQTEMMVRVNPAPKGLQEVKHLCHLGVSAFVLPKIEHPQEVLAFAQVLEEEGSESKLFPLIESPLGVENAFSIASSTSRVTALSLGLEDYVAELGAVRTAGQAESFYARSRVVNAARAAGVTPLASVFPQFSDPEAVFEYSSKARSEGYEGIGCIHPAQIEPAHRAFSPTEAELVWAKKVADAYEAAEAKGDGVVGVDGKMADLPTYNRALKTLRRGGMLP